LVGHVAKMDEDKECIQNFCGKPSWKMGSYKTKKEMRMTYRRILGN